jgi:hypothetical protein
MFGLTVLKQKVNSALKQQLKKMMSGFIASITSMMSYQVMLILKKLSVII